MLIGLVVGHCGGCAVSQREMQQQAVKQGAAEWEVHEDGSTTFKWKETTK